MVLIYCLLRPQIYGYFVLHLSVRLIFRTIGTCLHSHSLCRCSQSTCVLTYTLSKPTQHRLHHIHSELLSILFHHKGASALLITFPNHGSPIVRQAQEGQRRSKAAGPGRDDREAIHVTKYGQHSCANARQRYSSIMVTTSITVPGGRLSQLTSRGYQ